MATSGTSSDSGGYAIRPYTAADIDDVLTLYETVFEKSRSPEWFEWRYDSPYVDDPQVVVAERRGSVVGVEPFITFRFETGDDTTLAVQPADAMVHPDHRRQGLLTRMTEFALEYYTPREPSFVFNFPNRQAVDAYRKLGWREVPDVTSDLRVQNPGQFLDADERPGLQRVLEAGGRTVSNVLYALLEPGKRDDSITIDRYRDVPAATLASLYERDVPPALHARRDAEFFEWRLGNPDWSATTYVARQRGDPVAAMVAVVQRNGDCTFTKVMEALPMGGTGVESAMRRLLAAVCRNHGGSDVVKMAHSTVPRSITRKLGFLTGDRLPLSWLTTPSTMVVRPLDAGDDPWTVGDRTLTAWQDWEITYSEQDTSY